LNVTVPVAVPLPGETAATVAVNVTAWPTADGFTDDTTVVAVLALVTTCEIVLELLTPNVLVTPA